MRSSGVSIDATLDGYLGFAIQTLNQGDVNNKAHQNVYTQLRGNK